MQPVQMAYLDRMYAEIRERVEPKLLEAVRSGQFIQGPQLASFEQAIAGRYSFAHAVGMANGTDALMIGLRACGVGPGDEVIVPAFTIFVDAAVVRMLGAIPQFVDVLDDFNMDPQSFERAITPRTKAAIVVHLFGQTADMDAIMAIAREKGVKVVEDACQAIGAKCGDRFAGDLGDVGAFSFYPTKNLGCMGDGGLVSVRDQEIFKQIKLLHLHGIDSQPYVPELWGYNSRLDSIQAAILQEKLDYLSGWEARRRAIAAEYLARICNKKIRLPRAESGRHHVWHMFTVRVDDRARLIAHLQDRAICSSVFYPKIVPDIPAFKDIRSTQVQGDWPVSEALTQTAVSLPVNPQLTDEEVARVVDALNDY